MLDAEKYRLWAKLPVHTRRVNGALEAISGALSLGGTWALSYSGGKDSTALFGLLIETGWRGPLFHFYYAETPTENTEQARALANRYGLELHLLAVPGAFDVFREVGHFFAHPVTVEEKRAARKMLRGYLAAVSDYAAAQGWTGQFLGLRRAESRSRAIALAKKGRLYRTKDRPGWTCCPLATWGANDVWAYILTNGLPHLDRYSEADDPEAQRSEMTWLAAESLWRHGMAARLRKEQPEEFARLAAEWPEIRQYV